MTPTTRAVFLAMWTLLATFAVSELAVRVLQPTPPVQIVRDDHYGPLTEVHGHPVWHGLTGPIRGTPCDGPTVLLAGDSIFASMFPRPPPDAADKPPRIRGALQAALQRDLPDACALDVSQPAYTPPSQWAMARWAMARHEIDLLVFLMWKPDDPYVQVGEAAYVFAPFDRAPGGLPKVGGISWPDGPHRSLFRHSRLVEFATLTLGTRIEPTIGIDTYVEVRDRMAAEGIPVLFVEGTALDRPFAETERLRAQALASLIANGHSPELPPNVLREHKLRDAGIEALRLSELLSDQDVTAIRADTCCHYNPDGHHIVGERLAPHVLQRLDP